MKEDGRILPGGCLGSVCATEEDNPEFKEILAQRWDEISGRELDPKMVVGARKEEMQEYYKHKVYSKVPIKQCWDRTGKKPIGVRWIHINKGDDKHPRYRSRSICLRPPRRWKLRNW